MNRPPTSVRLRRPPRGRGGGGEEARSTVKPGGAGTGGAGRAGAGAGERGVARSAAVKAYDDGLRAEISALEAQLEGTSVASKHGLKRQIALKKAALQRNLPAGV